MTRSVRITVVVGALVVASLAILNVRNEGALLSVLDSKVTFGAGVSPAQYELLKVGMSYAEAVRLLRVPGTEQTRSTSAGLTTVSYIWPGRGDAGASMTALFRDGRLVSKTQFGLQ